MLRRGLRGVLRLVLGAMRDNGVAKPVINKEELALGSATVAFRITGGIGDHLIAARFIRDLIAFVGDFHFDIYSPRPDLAALIFSSFPQFNRSYDEYFSWNLRSYYRAYPLAMSISQFVTLQTEDIQSHQLASKNPLLVSVCEKIDRFRNANDLNEIISAHPRLDGALGSKAVFMNLNRHTFAHAMAGIPYGGDNLSLNIESKVLDKLSLRRSSYITVHNGFDALFLASGGYAKTSTKVYPHFGCALPKIKQAHPHLTIVQLGTTTSTQIPGVDIQLIGKTSFAETMAIVANSALHIDNEGGLVHLATCLKTPSVVVFGPTPAPYFGYSCNTNIAPQVCGGCWWSTRDWMTNCPKGYSVPHCTDKIDYHVVATKALEILASNGADQ